MRRGRHWKLSKAFHSKKKKLKKKEKTSRRKTIYQFTLSIHIPGLYKKFETIYVA